MALTLEHYFEMSKNDATKSLEIYRRFCFQTENFVAFLDASKRHSSQLRHKIPNLKHAPLSLAKALEEYLHETDFDQHESSRQRNAKGSEEAPPKPQEEPKMEPPPQEASSSKQALQDFFEALEQPHSTPFNSAYSGFTSFQTQPDWFGLQPMPATGLMPQVTGNPFNSLHGFMQPQGTGINPFTPQMPMTPYLTGQPTGFRVPQQQALMPQHTMNTTPFDSIFGQLSLQPTMAQAQPTGMAAQVPSMPKAPPSWTPPSKEPTSSPTPQTQQRVGSKEPPQPSAGTSNQQNLRPQKTGTMNPFSIPSDFEEPEPVHKAPPQPTLNELAMNAWSNKSSTQGKTENDGTDSRLVPQRTGLLGSVASEFVRPPQSVAVPVSDAKTDGASTRSGSQVFGTSHDVGHLPNEAGSVQFPGNASHFRAQQTMPSEPLPMTNQATGIGLGISGSASPAMRSMNQQGVSVNTTGMNTLSRFNTLPSDLGDANFKAQMTGNSAFAGTSSLRQNSLGDANLQSPGFSSLASQNGFSTTASSNLGHNPRLHEMSGHVGHSPGNLFLHQNNSQRVGLSQGLDHQSQITNLTGIKPFQPSSDFGTSLMRGTPQQPTQPTPATSEAPVPDLLQL